MSVFKMWISAGLLGTLCLPGIGCGGGADRPDLGTVTGKVMIGDKPFHDVIISFHPDSGRTASAVVDAQGNYDLVYLQGVRGTKVGPNTVSLEWPTGATRWTTIPDKYTSGKSTEKVVVKAGKNTFDFKLDPAPEGANAPASTTPVVD